MSLSDRIANKRKELSLGAVKNSVPSNVAQTPRTNLLQDRIEKKRLSLDVQKVSQDVVSLGSEIKTARENLTDKNTMYTLKNKSDALYNNLDRLYNKSIKTGADSSVASYLSQAKRAFGNGMNDWDDLTALYDSYKSQDAFDASMKKYSLTEKYKGKSYDEVQKILSLGAKSMPKDEREFLFNYGTNVGWNSLEDYDKNIAEWTKTGKNGQKMERAGIDGLRQARNLFDLEHRSDKWIAEAKNDPSYASKTSPLTQSSQALRPAVDNVSSDVDLLKFYEFASDDERDAYSYYLNTDPKKAQEMLDDMKIAIDKRYTENMEKNIADYSEAWGGWSVIPNAIGAVAALPFRGMGFVEDVVNTIKGEEINPYSMAHSATNFSNALTEANTQTLDTGSGFNIFGQDIGSFAYNALQSTAESIVGANLFGSMYTPIMGMSAASSKAREMKEQGYSDTDIAVSSFISGAIEAACEYLPTERYLTLQKADMYGIRRTLKGIFGQAAEEGLEEGVTEILNKTYDSFAHADSNEMSKMYKEYISLGYTEEEARTEVAKSIADDILGAMAGGALSGGIMGAQAKFSSSKAVKSEGREINEVGSVETLMRDADKTLGQITEENLKDEAFKPLSKYVDLYNRAKSGETLSDADTGHLLEGIKEAAEALGTDEARNAANDAYNYARDPERKAAEEAYKEAEKTRREELGEKVFQDTYKGVGKASDEYLRAKYNDDIADDFESVLETHKGKIDSESLMRAYTTAIEYGENGLFDEYDAIQATNNILTESESKKAFLAGYKHGQAQLQKVSAEVDAKIKNANLESTKYTQGKFDTEEIKGEKLTKYQKKNLQILKGLSKLGINVEVFASKVDENGKRKGENGSFNKNTNTIRIDIYSGLSDNSEALDNAIMSTVSHELTHWAEGKASELYKALSKSVFSILEDADGMNFEKRIDAEIKFHKAEFGRELYVKDAQSEVIARACEDCLVNSEKMYDMLLKLGDDSLRRRFTEALRNTAKKIIDLFGDIKGMMSRGETATTVRNAGKLEDVTKMWEDMLEKAIKANQAEMQSEAKEAKADTLEEKIQYQLREDEKVTKRIVGATYFSGGGLVDYALKNLVETEFGVEFDNKIAMVYQDNIGDRIHVGEVQDFIPEAYEDKAIEYFHASPVCKNFSIAKSNVTEEDSKIDIEMAEATARAIHALSDSLKVVTIENVPQYLDTDAYNIIIDELHNSGFVTDSKIYNAVDYGADTSRERLIVRAMKEGYTLPDVENNARTTSGWYDAVSDIIDTFKTREKPIANWMRERLDAMGIDYKNVSEPLYVFGEGEKNGQVRYAYASEPMPTIKATENMGVIFMPDGSVKQPTGRFFARITGLEDDYKLPKAQSLGKKIVGNGVPVKMTQNIIAPMLEEVLRSEGRIEGDDVQYQYRENVSPRQLLLNAEVNADNETESRLLTEYKWDAQVVENSMTRLDEIREALKTEKDTTKISALHVEQRTLERRVINYNRQLDKLEGTATLMKVYDRETVANVKRKSELAQSAAYQRAQEKAFELIAKRNEELYKQKYNMLSAKEKELKREMYKQMFDVQKSREEQARLRSKNAKELAKVKSSFEDKIAEIKRENNHRNVEKRNETERKKYFESILKTAKQMGIMLRANSVEKHVPKVMREAIADLISALDFTSRRGLGDLEGQKNNGVPYKKDIRISDAMQNFVNAVGNASATAKGVYDESYNIKSATEKVENDFVNMFMLLPEGTKEDLDNIVAKIRRFEAMETDGMLVLNRLTAAETKYVAQTMKAVLTTINNANRLYKNAAFEGVRELGKSDIIELTAKEIENRKPDGEITRFLGWKNLQPMRAFERISTGARSIFGELQRGFSTFAFRANDVVDFANNTFTGSEAKKWTNDTIDVMDYNGKTFKMSVAQAMSLYCLAKREQAQGHIYGYGVVVGQYGKGRKTVEDAKSHNMTIDGIVKLAEDLNRYNPKTLEVADALQNFMSTTCSEWGNEVSMARFGYEAFGEKNYFPIRVYDEHGTVTDSDETSLFRLLNASFAKPLTEHANNAIYVDNIFDVFAQHATEMAKYNALAMPVLDAFKWLNYIEKEDLGEGTLKTATSVRQAMRGAFGDEASKYVLNLIRDINGAGQSVRDEGGLKKLMSNVKRASVGANISVALLQPTSYFRAKAVIPYKYLALGLTNGHPRRAFKRACEYSGIAKYKALGFYDINASRSITSMIVRDDTILDKIGEISMKGAEMGDELTWGCLWSACEAKVNAENRNITHGSDEYYARVAEIFDEIIYKTQVIDTVLTRSQVMRDKSIGWQTYTAFMSEPTVSYNMFAAEVLDFNDTKKLHGVKFAAKKVAKPMLNATIAHLATSAASAIVRGFVNGLRNYDPDEDDDGSKLEELWEAYISEVTIEVPILKEVVEMMQGYTPRNLMLQGFQDAYYAYNDVKKLIDGKDVKFSKIFNDFTKAVSELSGVPGYGFLRDLKATWNATYAKYIDKDAYIE